MGQVTEAMVKALTQLDRNPETAANWAIEGAPESLRETAMGAAVGHWAAVDPLGAAEWLGQLPSGTATDTAVAELVDEITSDPERSFAWAKTISDPKLRARKLAEIVDQWSVYGAEAARGTIEESLLDPETKSELLKKSK